MKLRNIKSTKIRIVTGFSENCFKLRNYLLDSDTLITIPSHIMSHLSGAKFVKKWLTFNHG